MPPSPSPSSIQILRQWCEDNNIWIDPRLELRYDDKYGVGVYSTTTYIFPQTSLVHIHKNSVLSIRSCTLSDFITPVISGPEAQLTLSLALYVELLNGTSSRWFGYLQSLPKFLVDLPIFWTCRSSRNHFSDGDIGLKWLKGTEVERCTQNPWDKTLETINEYYFSTVEPLLLRHFERQDIIPTSKPTLEGFYHAYSLVSSRAFLVDAYHGLCMVPIADAFNHSQDNHVHLETDFNVCTHCGSLQECLHDNDESRDSLFFLPPSFETFQAPPRKGLDSYYEMVSNAVIPSYTEIFNTYGETLTNAQLLTQYGFILDDNENDHLTWDLQQVYQYCVDCSVDWPFTPDGLESIWNTVLQNLTENRILELFSESNLVYPHTENSFNSLYLNGDGKISHQLWIFLALPLLLDVNQKCLEERPVDVMTILKELEELLKFQLTREHLVETRDIGEGVYLQQPGVGPATSTLTRLAYLVINLCISRKHRLGKCADMSTEQDLNTFLDTLPADMCRTRGAVTIVIGEQSLLDSCKSTWEEMSMISQ